MHCGIFKCNADTAYKKKINQNKRHHALSGSVPSPKSRVIDGQLKKTKLVTPKPVDKKQSYKRSSKSKVAKGGKIRLEKLHYMECRLHVLNNAKILE